jgi:hypothetical protein
MRKISNKPGIGTFQSEVSNISSFGFWLLVEDKEYFVPFSDYPQFRNATVEQILGMRQISPSQFHWQDLDIDIEIDALETPDRFPLKFRK